MNLETDVMTYIDDLQEEQKQTIESCRKIEQFCVEEHNNSIIILDEINKTYKFWKSRIKKKRVTATLLTFAMCIRDADLR